MAEAEQKSAPLKILIVDDDEPIREYLRFLLEKKGYSVECAGDGMTGLELFAKGNFSCVITDVLMPEKDGIEMLIELKKIAPRIPVIVMSGVQERDKLLSIAGLFNAEAILKKPFDDVEVASALALCGF
jgi:CheY-like chemotaxis protein